MFERIPPRERLDLLIAWIAISIAFTLIFVRDRVEPLTFFIFLGVSLVTVGIGFILHEMAHKFTAMHYGYWAEFRKDNLMLVVAVALAALVGVVFAAPGATVIYGTGVTREQNGRISAAGPLTNLILCIPFAVLTFLAGSGTSLIGIIGVVGLQVNGMIAAFNMLPVSVLDGRKVLAWNKGIFAVLIAAAFAVVIATFYLV
ncbi:MAG: peptidase M50 [Methanoregulaceae archaeon]|nr:peptidase M50 [Methanoregulaceae archaeon]